jgi:hypothetical protein
MAFDPAHSARGCLAPLLGEQEPLVEHVERPAQPCIALEPAVACRRLDEAARLPGSRQPALDVIARDLIDVVEQQQRELHPLAG